MLSVGYLLFYLFYSKLCFFCRLLFPPVQLKRGQSPGGGEGGARRPHATSRTGRRRWRRGRGGEVVKIPKSPEKKEDRRRREGRRGGFRGTGGMV